MIYPITVYGDPVLRKVAQPVETNDEELKIFIKDLWETMYVSDGVGLAAPQTGRSVRVFVIDASSGADQDPELKNFRKTFINPEITEYDGTPVIINEGCLSIPGIREDISRPDQVTIRYLDENFNENMDVFKGFVARIVQHEYDHLQGKLFIDYLNPLKKRLLKNKLSNISKGKVETHYQIKIPSV